MKEELTRLNIQRGAIKRQLTSFFNFVCASNIDLAVLQTRYNRLPAIWEKYEQASIEIECLINEAGDETALQEHIKNIETYERMYYEASSKAQRLLTEFENRSEHQSRNEATHSQNQENNIHLKVKLPPLTIQPFSGDYSEWLSFKDSFQKAVHDQPGLPNIQKFQILRGLLLKDALRLISALEATDENYIVAWKLLSNRYANKRLIINTHIMGIFDLPYINKANQINLRNMVDNIRTHIRSLESLKQPVKEWDTIMIYLLSSKLDNTTKEEWEREISTQGIETLPTLESFLEFLERRCLMLEMTNKGKLKQEVESTITRKFPKRTTLMATSAKTNNLQCVVCRGHHAIYNCERFEKLPVNKRYEESKRLKLCTNCLKGGHIARECRSSKCRRCNQLHNTLLHYEKQINKSNIQPENVVLPNVDESSIVAFCEPKENIHILLSTAMVYIEDEGGQRHLCRALLDPGSQVNLITEEIVDKLKLSCTSDKFSISGIDNSNLNTQKTSKIKLTSTTSTFSSLQNCLVISTISERIPQVHISKKESLVPRGIKLADPTYDIPGKIDLLIGAGLFWKLICPGESISRKGYPHLQKTYLGWILGGDYNKNEKAVCHLVTNCMLEKQIEQFWNIEDSNCDQEDRIKQDQCEQHFSQTHTRDKEGRFVVKLPQNTNIKLGESFSEALKRFEGLERRFLRQPDLKNEYVKIMIDYEQKGHMSISPNYNKRGEQYFMPLHMVLHVHHF